MTFKEWFKSELPNTYKGVNKEKLETFVYQCSKSAWNHQQAKIDELTAKIESAIDFINCEQLGDYAILGNFRAELEGILK